MAQFKTEMCKCCGQTIAKTVRQSHTRHIETVCELYDVTIEELESKNKNGYLAIARHHLWFLLVIEDMWNLKRAGRRYNRQHHAVLYGIRRHAGKHLKTQEQATLDEIRQVYWESLGLSEQEIQERIFG